VHRDIAIDQCVCCTNVKTWQWCSP